MSRFHEDEDDGGYDDEDRDDDDWFNGVDEILSARDERRLAMMENAAEDREAGRGVAEREWQGIEERKEPN